MKPVKATMSCPIDREALNSARVQPNSSFIGTMKAPAT